MNKTICQGAEAIITLVTPTPLKKFSSLITSSTKKSGKADFESINSSAQHEQFIIKNRIPKTYRIKELDDTIRKRRTKSETKLLAKASNLINSPAPIGTGGQNTTTSPEDKFKIQMPFINGKKLSEHLDSFSLTKQKQICKKIGESVAKLHNKDIIHGDLTTSNMIYIPAKGDDGKEENLLAHSRSQINKTDNKKSSSLIKSPTKKSGKADFEAINRASAPIIYFIDFGLGFISHKHEDKAVDLHLLKQALETKHFKHWKQLFDNFLKGYKKFKNSKIVLERLKAVEKRGRYKH